MPVTCSHCSASIAPTVMDLVPSSIWAVTIDCPACAHTNRLPWLVSFLLVGLATAMAFATAIPLRSAARIPGGVAIALVVAACFALVRAVLLVYLRLSRRPFSSSGDRARRDR